MSRFPEALSLAAELKDPDVARLIEQWEKEAEKLSSLFFPCHREPLVGHQWIFRDVRQSDILLKAPHGVVLGLRMLLQCQDGEPIQKYPLVLMFHGEDQNIDTFTAEENRGLTRCELNQTSIGC